MLTYLFIAPRFGTRLAHEHTIWIEAELVESCKGRRTHSHPMDALRDASPEQTILVLVELLGDQAPGTHSFGRSSWKILKAIDASKLMEPFVEGSSPAAHPHVKPQESQEARRAIREAVVAVAVALAAFAACAALAAVADNSAGSSWIAWTTIALVVTIAVIFTACNAAFAVEAAIAQAAREKARAREKDRFLKGVTAAFATSTFPTGTTAEPP